MMEKTFSDLFVEAWTKTSFYIEDVDYSLISDRLKKLYEKKGAPKYMHDQLYVSFQFPHILSVTNTLKFVAHLTVTTEGVILQDQSGCLIMWDNLRTDDKHLLLTSLGEKKCPDDYSEELYQFFLKMLSV